MIRTQSNLTMNAMARTAAITSIASLTLLTSALAQPQYHLTELAVPAGVDTSIANGLNDRGDVVGYVLAGTDSFASVGGVWRNGVFTSLGRLPGGNYSSATAISPTGVIVGDGDNGNIRPQSWVTTPTGLYNFFANNGGNTHALFVSDAGWIGGYYTKSLSGNTASWRGSIWTVDKRDPRKYRQVDLPVIAGIDPKSTTALPMAFNRGGQAAGYAMNDVIGQHASFWNNNASHTIVDLGTLPGDSSSLAWGMNDLGQVVGESHPPFGSRPVLWNNDALHTPVELPLLPGDNYGAATAINGACQILGWSAVSEPGTWNSGPARLVLWSDGGVFELQSLLDASAEGWTLSAVTAINISGQIVGYGVRGGVTRAFVLTPMNR